MRLRADGEMTACLSGTSRIAPGDVDEAVRVPLVAKRAAREPRHAAGMAGREGDREAVGVGVRQPLHGIGPEIVILPLLAVGDDRGAGGLEPLDGVADRLLVQGIQARVVHAFSGDRLDQLLGPRDAADRLRGNWGHARRRARSSSHLHRWRPRERSRNLHATAVSIAKRGPRVARAGSSPRERGNCYWLQYSLPTSSSRPVTRRVMAS